MDRIVAVVRDLKRVNAHLAAAAYPILEGRGELLPSRLRQDANNTATMNC